MTSQTTLIALLSAAGRHMRVPTARNMRYGRRLTDVPKSANQNYVVEIENRIEKLQKEMEKQMTKSNILLSKVKNHLKKKPKEVSKEDSQNIEKSSNPVLPVLVIACDRVTVKRCLDSLIKYRPNKETFPIIVSQPSGKGKLQQIDETNAFRATQVSIRVNQVLNTLLQ
ncbi:Alpha-1,3-mannosyl-glycoprotein 2-beta-N-acetylglucosaminyltransferase [Eumeta japonica]|uniref:Alpha-1,3-mannosyl-glycoprotein 2-beta-N-acetylglucosaminyltransferase n=1 Tax=Eumeta variegata TaxID=151549 RepID=A0A4C1VGY0_EUMVA|nr:Alpha-1,3-mannosyl-glycoprotein 2-beta-N-acetylglucosaminyltransferase [Eumeta japonica]